MSRAERPDEAAGDEPAVVDRLRPPAQPGIGPPARRVRIVAKLRGPQRPTNVHLVILPRMTKVMAGTWPARCRAEVSGARRNRTAEARLVSIDHEALLVTESPGAVELSRDSSSIRTELSVPPLSYGGAGLRWEGLWNCRHRYWRIRPRTAAATARRPRSAQR